MCREYDIPYDDTIPQIAFAFAGGLGNTGSVCGAVTGAVMALSLTMDTSQGMEQAMAELGKVQEFRRRFEEKMGTISCRELTGFDLTDPKAVGEFMQSDVPKTACFPAVALAYELALDILGPK